MLHTVLVLISAEHVLYIVLLFICFVHHDLCCVVPWPWPWLRWTSNLCRPAAAMSRYYWIHKIFTSHLTLWEAGHDASSPCPPLSLTVLINMERITLSYALHVTIIVAINAECLSARKPILLHILFCIGMYTCIMPASLQCVWWCVTPAGQVLWLDLWAYTSTATGKVNTINYCVYRPLRNDALSTLESYRPPLILLYIWRWLAPSRCCIPRVQEL